MLHLNTKGAAVQNNPHTTLVTADGPIANDTHGGRAKCLQRLVRLDLPVPRTVALSFDAVQKIAEGHLPDVDAVVAQFPKEALLCVRPSSQDPDWGGPGAVLNIGINGERFDEFCQTMGEEPAAALYTRFVQTYAINVARLDPDMFDDVTGDGRAALEQSLWAYEARNRGKLSRRIRANSWRAVCAPWRGRGKAPRHGFCGRPRGRRRMRGWGWWCRR